MKKFVGIILSLVFVFICAFSGFAEEEGSETSSLSTTSSVAQQDEGNTVGDTVSPSGQGIDDSSKEEKDGGASDAGNPSEEDTNKGGESGSENVVPSGDENTDNGENTGDEKSEVIYVYITEEGYYHKDKCGDMKEENTTKITLEEAQEKGYKPCDVCYEAPEKSAEGDSSENTDGGENTDENGDPIEPEDPTVEPEDSTVEPEDLTVEPEDPDENNIIEEDKTITSPVIEKETNINIPHTGWSIEITIILIAIIIVAAIIAFLARKR